MKRLPQWGATLLILGIGSFLLPMLGMQFRLFDVLQPAQPAAGIVCAALGLIMLLLGLRGRSAAQRAAVPQPVAVPPPQIARPAAAAVPVQERTPMNTSNASGGGFCGSCGAPMEASETFCGSCGAPRAAEIPAAAPSAQNFAQAAQTYAAPVAAAAAPAPAPSLAPKKKSTGLKIALAIVLIIVLGVGGWFAWTSGLLRRSANKHQPAIPAKVAGTLTEFPIDGASLNPTHPTNVVTQPLSPSTTPTFQPNSLPPGITPRRLSNIGNSITSAQYKNKPEDTPVSVHVVDVNGGSGEMAKTMAGDISAASPDSSVTGVNMKGVSGDTYSGYKIKNPQTQTYVFAKDNAPTVIVIYAPDPASIAISDRLATTIGNGAGLTADSGVTDQMSVLPAALPPGIQLVEMHTYNVSDFISPQQLAEAIGQQGGGSPQLASQVQSFLPDRAIVGRYRDAANKEFNLIVGDYGSTISAWKTWMFLKAFSGAANLTSIDVGDISGLTVAQDGQRIVLFQTGPHLAVVVGPDEAMGNRVLELAKAVQY